MRLAIDLRCLLDTRRGGVETYTIAMVKELLKRSDIEVDLFYQARKASPFIHEIFPKVRYLAHSNSWFHLKYILGCRNLPQSYFKNEPDLIWLPDRRPFYKTVSPVVMTVHDQIPEHLPQTLSWKSRLWHWLFPLKKMFPLCAGLLTPSLYVMQSLSFPIPKEVTYEGATLSKTALVPKGVKKPFFLSLSPADPRKRLDWVLGAAQKFPKKNFVIAGLKIGDARFKKMRMIWPSNITTLGLITEEEKKGLYENAEALLALSREEGFDLPVLEAVIAHCPVILSDIPVHRELYKKGEFVKTEEDLWGRLYNWKRAEHTPPEPRGHYTWEKAAQRASLFFTRIILNKNRKDSGHRNGNDHTKDAESLKTYHHG